MSEEVELAAKSTGAVVGAVLEASGVAEPMQEVTGCLRSANSSPQRFSCSNRMASGAIGVQGTESGTRMWQGEAKGIPISVYVATSCASTSSGSGTRQGLQAPYKPSVAWSRCE